MFHILRLKFRKTMIPLRTPHRMKSLYRRGLHFFFNKNLFLTNSITSGAFMAIGDMAQQEFQFHVHSLPARYDWERIGRMFAVGTLMGPLHHWYYVYLDKLIPEVTVKTAVTKIVCDQLLASPATILFFFYGLGILEKKSLEESTDEIKGKFLEVYLGDCLYWPPIQFINFYFIPTRYRVFYINGATMIFNVFLSYMKHHYH